MATKRLQRAVDELRHRKDQCALFDGFGRAITCGNCGLFIGEDAKQELLDELKRDFNTWWATWIETQLTVIEKG